eukprot:TRINITY_DN6816_c0_g1_i9.p1 TRINITY_DN6816_c0_g1~~TRINITY_DN6816_c0_g1_i9.p1  ORF type:complete len:132 (+),score=0.13 TRINITY_DN6816_c0_g1_i9:186-581(+)
MKNLKYSNTLKQFFSLISFFKPHNVRISLNGANLHRLKTNFENTPNFSQGGENLNACTRYIIFHFFLADVFRLFQTIFFETCVYEKSETFEHPKAIFFFNLLFLNRIIFVSVNQITFNEIQIKYIQYDQIS